MALPIKRPLICPVPGVGNDFNLYIFQALLHLDSPGHLFNSSYDGNPYDTLSPLCTPCMVEDTIRITENDRSALFPYPTCAKLPWFSRHLLGISHKSSDIDIQNFRHFRHVRLLWSPV